MITKQMQKYGKVDLQAYGKAISSGDMYTACRFVGKTA